MPRIMACNITHFDCSQNNKNLEQEWKKEKACSSPGMLTARVWTSFLTRHFSRVVETAFA